MSASHPRLVDARWVADHLDDPSIRLVDATVHLTFDADGAHTESGRETYRQAHLPGAVFADQLTDLTVHGGEAPFEATSSQELARVIGGLGIGDEHTVVAYDTVNGIWATRLWWQFAFEGHDDVVVLDGGLKAWRDAGLPVESGDVQHEPASFTAERHLERSVGTTDVEAATRDSGVLLINALDRESFASGRIPGSVNVPFPELVDEQGRLKSLDELRPLFESVGALDPKVAPVTYCGGGIAATAVAFALKGLGRDDVAVYDGSLNAWTADPDRPIEKDA
ncbi:thiosulfate sulfurtransferase [Aeromicrobium flavum]|uniref:Thiosulfate sulfurtransferase n=1 Tax=Aeromicrobium flavum TaxID=416568 RepID=A0A512HQQ4_9ACTN|nr:sulfurtransferase [Aeromicrobium flavum]GEO87690.1 thiosulfate sulfurtransferase [Aeromicrobium flavum]